MAGEFVVTVGAASQLEDVFTGKFLKGRGEPRFAMVGRSNVGKSSLINSLLNGKFAQTSNQPGKTRAIHFYLWKDAKRIIADLPGYGYAKASGTERDRWAEFIGAYLKFDVALEIAIVLLDARHGPTDLDVDAIQFLLSIGVPVVPVFTKADQLKTQGERAARRKEAEAELKKLGCDPTKVFWVSSKAKDLGLKKFTLWLLNPGKGDAG